MQNERKEVVGKRCTFVRFYSEFEYYVYHNTVFKILIPYHACRQRSDEM